MKEETIEGFRLSAQQRRLWHWLSLTHSSAFRSAIWLNLSGPLDAERLRRAWARTVERHEALRTSYETVAGLEWPVQVINESVEGEYEEVECGCGGGGEECERASEEWERVVRGEVGGKGGWGVRVVECGEGRCALMVWVDGMSGDGVTMRNIAAELVRFYAEGIDDAEASEAPIQYVQYSEWQHELMEGEEGERAREQWGNGVAGLQRGVVRLAREREVKEYGSYEPRQVEVEVSAETERGLRGVAEESGAGVGDVLEAAWRVLLWKLSGEGEVSVARRFDGRTYEELGEVFGLFAKYIPLHTRLAGGLRFDEVLGRVRAAASEAGAWQDYFVGDAITEENALENSSRIGFSFDAWPAQYSADGVRFTLVRIESRIERFKLCLSATDAGGSLRLLLSYDPAFYTAETAARFAGELSVLLSDVAVRPRSHISKLDVLGERERRRLLVEWNDTARDFPTGLCVHQMLEAQVARTPELTAVVSEGERLTFKELNRKANQLAHHLRALGVGPEARVGLLMERSAQMLVALFAVLKAGGAYVPLDPEYPAERLSFMLEDAAIEVLLTKQALVNALPEYAGRVVCVDAEREEIERRGAENPGGGAMPENLAYIIYTSGSTGRPKGVMIEHRSAVNLARALAATVYAGLDGHLRVSLNAPLGFDASIKQVVQLLHGHALCIIPEEVRLDSAAFVSYLAQERVEVLDCTPSQLRWLLDEGLDERADVNLRAALVGGEAIDASLWQRLGESSRTAFFNVYGPTECCVDTTAARIQRQTAEATIGRPLPNVRVYILDENQQPVPVGMVGEIYVGGAGVGRGYLNRPDLTAQKFLPDPFSQRPGDRLYRTGDLARFLPDGHIEYIGRLDHQVKLRGLRIELGEIESLLEEHPSVKECAVLMRPADSGDNRLVAYVVPSSTEQLSSLDDSSRYRLPNGMLIAHQNRNETDNLYQEIFQDRVYLRYGIHLPADACVFDVGANIGMFTLFVSEHCPQARIYAFEPLKPIHEKLQINARRYSARTKLFAYGLSDEEKMETFTYYPRYTAKSGVRAYADAVDEVAVVKRFLRNQQQQGVSEAVSLLEVEDEILGNLFESETQQCRLKRLSDVIREQGVEHIDLLKVDVQRAEMDVLRGLEEEDWKKIEQLVMEVHDGEEKATSGRVNQIREMLEERGFNVIVEQDEYLEGTDRYNLYAARHELKREIGRQSDGVGESERLSSRIVVEEELSEEELERFLRERVPEYMVPSGWVMMERLPLTQHGKVDRGALPAPEEVEGRREREVVKARTPTEEMVVAVWSEVLGVAEVGADSDFFELGGHSLIATRVVSRLREHFGIELPLRVLFREPTPAALAAHIDAALRADAGVDAPPIEPAPRDGEVPLSFAQKRLWFLHQWEPTSSFYNSPLALRLSGRLDVEALRRTLREIVRRHESLRTTFIPRDGAPVQFIHSHLEVELPLIDLSSLDEAERERAAQTLAREEAQRPFDLQDGPLLRAALLRLSEAEHVALFTTHHIVSDGWSLGVLIKEVAALYEAFSGGRPSPLEELPLQYADYAVWQHRYLEGEVLGRQLDYWRKQLAGAPAMLNLPTDRPRPSLQTYRGASFHFSLNHDLSQQLRLLSRREGVTPFMTLLAAFQLLLSRYAGQEDVVVGTAIANRTRRETENLIGFFVNTLVLRTDLSGEPRFTELLKRVREVCLGAYAHQDIPFERLVEELRPERSLSHSPLFQVMFVLHNEPSSELELPGLRLSAVGGEHSPAKFDLRLSLGEAATGELGGVLTFNTDLFDAATASRMTEHFRRLLERIVADPSRRLSEFSLLGRDEERLLLSEWSTMRTDFGPPACLHELFERQVEATPERVAVVCEGERLTYEELNRRANRLAHYLRSLGVGPEVRVGLLSEPSMDAVVAVFGILKAGGAYVGLDPRWPARRLAFALSDAGARVLVADSALLTQTGLKQLLETSGDETEKSDAEACRVFCPDAEREELANWPETNPAPAASPENLAYLIYTSGSTGQPKAVMGEHRQVFNYVRAASERLGLADDSYVMQQSLAVDAPVTYLFASLSMGGQLHLPGRELTGDAERLADYLGRERIACFKVAPSHLAVLLAGQRPEALMPRKVLLVGGEALGQGLVEKALTFGDGCALVNHYGPTETTVGALTYHAHRAAEAGAGSVVPLGRPLANTRVYILDRNLRPSPIGTQGEIYIGGAGVARGYLNRPDLTAERFVPDPFGDEPGARLYRTGDLGRWLEVGDVEFLGRIDHQVKVRGFRVEVEEVETALEAHPGVRSAVVEARRDHRGEMRLVCYLIWAGATDESGAAASAEGGDVEALRRWALARLPDYMVPSAWVELSELPRTPQGKVDRRSLPEPAWEASLAAAEYEEPADELERQVAGVFARVLGLERVGATDNFFALGGHSLLATRVVSQLRHQLGVEVSLRELFEHPTVRGLSARLRERVRAPMEEAPRAVEIKRVRREGRRVRRESLDKEELLI